MPQSSISVSKPYFNFASQLYICMFIVKWSNCIFFLKYWRGEKVAKTQNFPHACRILELQDWALSVSRLKLFLSFITDVEISKLVSVPPFALLSSFQNILWNHVISWMVSALQKPVCCKLLTAWSFLNKYLLTAEVNWALDINHINSLLLDPRVKKSIFIQQQLISLLHWTLPNLSLILVVREKNISKLSVSEKNLPLLSYLMLSFAIFFLVCFFLFGIEETPFTYIHPCNFYFLLSRSFLTCKHM